MPMLDIDYFKRHGSGAVNGIFGPTGKTESTVATKWNKFKISALTTTIHCTTKRRVTTVNHTINIFNDRFSRV